LELTRRRFAAVVNSAYDGIICVDLNQRIQLMNEAAKTMFGVDDSIVGTRLETLLPHRFRSQHEHYTSGFRQSPIASRSMALRAALFGFRSDGTEFPLDITIAKITVGETTEMMAVMRDNSDRARLIEELKLSATTDFLTNVPNRRALMNTATTEFSRSVRFGRAMSVLMFDIDHFKHVNDNFGHPAGDLVLQNIVNRAKTALREVDMLGRWGGEEFVVILPETEEAAAIKCAERLRLAVESKPFAMSDAGVEAPITVSVGVATRIKADGTVDELFSRADAALYRAKQAGRNQISA
jgi:diguanylate cyclase (GGDEF)-like protein/PAS domain S-box-containing protein